MSEVSKDSPKAGGVLCSGKQGGIFSFTSAGHDAGDDGGEGMSCAVDFEGQVMIAEEKVSAGDGTGVGTREVRGINVPV